MDKRFQNYIFIYAASLVAYIIILLGGVGIGDSLIPALFFITSLAFVFTREEKISEEEMLYNPQLHYYQKSRLNIYGYTMAAALVVSAVIFFIFTYITSISPALICMILWTGVVVTTRFAGEKADRDEFIEIVSDFIKFNMKDSAPSDKDLQIVLKSFFRYKKSIANLDTLESNIKLSGVNLPRNILEEVHRLFIKYIEGISQEEVISDEVRELNKGK